MADSNIGRKIERLRKLIEPRPGRPEKICFPEDDAMAPDCEHCRLKGKINCVAVIEEVVTPADFATQC